MLLTAPHTPAPQPSFSQWSRHDANAARPDGLRLPSLPAEVELQNQRDPQVAASGSEKSQGAEKALLQPPLNQLAELPVVEESLRKVRGARIFSRLHGSPPALPPVWCNSNMIKQNCINFTNT